MTGTTDVTGTGVLQEQLSPIKFVSAHATQEPEGVTLQATIKGLNRGAINHSVNLEAIILDLPPGVSTRVGMMEKDPNSEEDPDSPKIYITAGFIPLLLPVTDSLTLKFLKIQFEVHDLENRLLKQSPVYPVTLTGTGKVGATPVDGDAGTDPAASDGAANLGEPGTFENVPNDDEEISSVENEDELSLEGMDEPEDDIDDDNLEPVNFEGDEPQPAPSPQPQTEIPAHQRLTRTNAMSTVQDSIRAGKVVFLGDRHIDGAAHYFFIESLLRLIRNGQGRNFVVALEAPRDLTELANRSPRDFVAEVRRRIRNHLYTDALETIATIAHAQGIPIVCIDSPRVNNPNDPQTDVGMASDLNDARRRYPGRGILTLVGMGHVSGGGRDGNNAPALLRRNHGLQDNQMIRILMGNIVNELARPPRLSYALDSFDYVAAVEHPNRRQTIENTRTLSNAQVLQQLQPLVNGNQYAVMTLLNHQTGGIEVVAARIGSVQDNNGGIRITLGELNENLADRVIRRSEAGPYLGPRDRLFTDQAGILTTWYPYSVISIQAMNAPRQRNPRNEQPATVTAEPSQPTAAFTGAAPSTATAPADVSWQDTEVVATDPNVCLSGYRRRTQRGQSSCNTGR